MKPSEEIKEFIKKFEGLCLTATRCSAGVPTIGYGHTGPEVQVGQKISRERADEIFSKDIDYFSEKVGKIVPKTLTQHQFDALISFAFNCGVSALSNSTLLRKVNANPANPEIRVEFMKWVNAGGKKLQGLVNRRKAEADWYFN